MTLLHLLYYIDRLRTGDQEILSPLSRMNSEIIIHFLFSRSKGQWMNFIWICFSLRSFFDGFWDRRVLPVLNMAKLTMDFPSICDGFWDRFLLPVFKVNAALVKLFPQYKSQDMSSEIFLRVATSAMVSERGFPFPFSRSKAHCVTFFPFFCHIVTPHNFVFKLHLRRFQSIFSQKMQNFLFQTYIYYSRWKIINY